MLDPGIPGNVHLRDHTEKVGVEDPTKGIFDQGKKAS